MELASQDSQPLRVLPLPDLPETAASAFGSGGLARPRPVHQGAALDPQGRVAP